MHLVTWHSLQHRVTADFLSNDTLFSDWQSFWRCPFCAMYVYLCTHTHIQPWEARISCLLQQHGWNLRSLKLKKDKCHRMIPLNMCNLLKKPNSSKQSRMVVVSGTGVRGELRCWSSSTNFQLQDELSSGNLMWGMVLIVSNTVLYVWKLLRE